MDGLPLTVVELDGTAVAPFDLPWLQLAVAQRAVVLLDWRRLAAGSGAAAAVAVRFAAVSMYMPGMAAPANQSSTSSTLAGAPALFDPHWAGAILFEPGAQPPPPQAAPLLSPALPGVAAAADANLLAARSWPPAPAPAATQFATLSFGFANDALGVNRGYVNGATYAPPAAGLAVPVLHSFLAAAPLAVPAALSGNVSGDALRPFLLPHNRVVELNIVNLDTGLHPFHRAS